MPRYVVQEHDAEKAKLHWDFYLEDEDNPGMFHSWVIKKLGKVKQPCYLMISKPAHSESCVYFEGTYPSGSYGAGPIFVWDKGTYEYLREEDNNTFVYINGEKLKGVYKIVAKADGNHLLCTTNEEYDPDEEVNEDAGEDCHECEGEGWIGSTPCACCDGKGVL